MPPLVDRDLYSFFFCWGRWIPYRRLDSYLKVGSSIYKQCTEEAKNGLLIRVINEVDVFVDDKKTLRATEVRRSKEGTEFTFMEKITRP